jgi:regulator of protease activity HflC (stomatin/prohibitin superfamily)
MTVHNSPATKAAAVGIGFLVVSALLGGVLAYRQVPEGHEGVTKQWGAVTGQTLDPGAHWKVPIMESVQDVEIRPRTYTMADISGEGAKPQQKDAVVVQSINGTSPIRIDVTVRYRIEEANADAFVAEWHNERQMEHRLIRPTVRSTLRDEAAGIASNVIYTQDGRERLADAAKEALTEEFHGQPIHLEAVQVRDVEMPDSYVTALNQKAVAKQRIQEEKHNVKAEQQRKRQKIIRAEAQAESVRIRSDAYEANPVILRVEYIEALQDGSVFVVPRKSETPVILDGSNVTAAGDDNGTAPTPTLPGGRADGG